MIGFGGSRNKLLKGFNVNKTSPGPAAYELSCLIGKDAKKFTLKAKIEHDPNKTTKFFPGPGKYSVLSTISPQGKYAVSCLKNICTIKLVPGKRFSEYRILLLNLRFHITWSCYLLSSQNVTQRW